MQIRLCAACVAMLWLNSFSTKTLLPDMGPANRYLRRVYPGLQAGGTMESQLSAKRDVFSLQKKAALRAAFFHEQKLIPP